MDRCESCRFWERENTLRLGKHPAMTLYDLRPAEVAVIKERRR